MTVSPTPSLPQREREPTNRCAKLTLIDTHCHLDAAEFGSSQEALLQAAQTAGVKRIIIPSVERANFSTVYELCKKFTDCVPAYGIHPMYTNDAKLTDLDELRGYLRNHHPVAVGEIGLDFFIAHYDRTRQEHFFALQLKLAREFDLPVLLHIRRAQDSILKHLRQARVRGGIAHAFNGSRSQAEEFIRLGFKLGFGGALTYPRATRLRELATILPLESIVLETDAPDIPPLFLKTGEPNGHCRYITPDNETNSARFPHPNPPPEGEGTNESLREFHINKPEYLPRIAQTLAELRGIPLEEIAEATTTNALSVLPKLKINDRTIIIPP